MGIADRTIFAVLTSKKRNTRKLDQLKKKLETCTTQKCPKNHARLRRLKKIHDKDLANTCTQKGNMAFYNCSVKVFDASTYKKAKEEYKTCNEKECSKEYADILQEAKGFHMWGL
jgi:hypothetical protein